MCWHHVYILVNKTSREQNGVTKLMLIYKQRAECEYQCTSRNRGSSAVCRIAYVFVIS